VAQGRDTAVVSNLGKTSAGNFKGEIVIEKLTAFLMGIAVWALMAFVLGMLTRPFYELFMLGWGVFG
jgi:hypothetical protein